MRSQSSTPVAVPPAPPAARPAGLWAATVRRTLDPIQAVSLHHQVQAYILRATHEGRLRPGDRLNESALSAQLEISRTPVREALTYLEGTGLVVRRPRRGFFLASLSAGDAEHCYAMREVLEGYAARALAGRLSEAQIEPLEAVIDAMGRAVEAGDWPQAALCNITFHETVVGAAGNPVLLRMWQSVGPALWVFDALSRRTVDASATREFVQRHRALLDVLRGADPGAAEGAFAAHIAEVRRVVVRRLQIADNSPKGEGR